MRTTPVYRETKIDLTPMLDVVFILLIFFVVTATFVKEAGIDVNPPDESIRPPVIKVDKDILIGISSRSRISVGGQEVDRRLLAPLLHRLHAENPKAAVILSSHDEADTGTMVFVMDQARSVGLEKISLAKG